MMTQKAVLAAFKKTEALLEGHFELRSKLHSNRSSSWHGDALLLGAVGLRGRRARGAGASGHAAGRRGDDRKIEVVEVMAAPLAGAGGSGAPPGVTG